MQQSLLLFGIDEVDAPGFFVPLELGDELEARIHGVEDRAVAFGDLLSEPSDQLIAQGLPGPQAIELLALDGRRPGPSPGTGSRRGGRGQGGRDRGRARRILGLQAGTHEEDGDRDRGEERHRGGRPGGGHHPDTVQTSSRRRAASAAAAVRQSTPETRKA